MLIVQNRYVYTILPLGMNTEHLNGACNLYFVNNCDTKDIETVTDAGFLEGGALLK